MHSVTRDDQFVAKMFNTYDFSGENLPDGTNYDPTKCQ